MTNGHVHQFPEDPLERVKVLSRIVKKLYEQNGAYSTKAATARRKMLDTLLTMEEQSSEYLTALEYAWKYCYYPAVKGEEMDDTMRMFAASLCGELLTLQPTSLTCIHLGDLHRYMQSDDSKQLARQFYERSLQADESRGGKALNQLSLTMKNPLHAVRTLLLAVNLDGDPTHKMCMDNLKGRLSDQKLRAGPFARLLRVAMGHRVEGLELEKQFTDAALAWKSLVSSMVHVWDELAEGRLVNVEVEMMHGDDLLIGLHCLSLAVGQAQDTSSLCISLLHECLLALLKVTVKVEEKKAESEDEEETLVLRKRRVVGEMEEEEGAADVIDLCSEEEDEEIAPRVRRISLPLPSDVEDEEDDDVGNSGGSRIRADEASTVTSASTARSTTATSASMVTAKSHLDSTSSRTRRTSLSEMGEGEDVQVEEKERRRRCIYQRMAVLAIALEWLHRAEREKKRNNPRYAALKLVAEKIRYESLVRCVVELLNSTEDACTAMSNLRSSPLAVTQTSLKWLARPSFLTVSRITVDGEAENQQAEREHKQSLDFTALWLMRILTNEDGAIAEAPASSDLGQAGAAHGDAQPGAEDAKERFIARAAATDSLLRKMATLHNQAQAKTSSRPSTIVLLAECLERRLGKIRAVVERTHDVDWVVPASELARLDERKTVTKAARDALRFIEQQQHSRLCVMPSGGVVVALKTPTLQQPIAVLSLHPKQDAEKFPGTAASFLHIDTFAQTWRG